MGDCSSKSITSTLESDDLTSEASLDSLQVPERPGQYLDFLNACLRACNGSHADVCVPTSIFSRVPDARPSFLIDVRRNCIVDVKEFSIGQSEDPSEHRYVALSYVWPKSTSFVRSQSLVLEHAKLAHFKTPGFFNNSKVLERIPEFAKYAIALTSQLHERYLWVDRFCIVQDDKTTAFQVSHMNDIWRSISYNRCSKHRCLICQGFDDRSLADVQERKGRTTGFSVSARTAGTTKD